MSIYKLFLLSVILAFSTSFGYCQDTAQVSNDGNTALPDSMAIALDSNAAPQKPEKVKKERNNPFNYSINVCPELNSLQVRHQLSEYDAFSGKPNFGYSAGLSLEYQLLKNIWVEIGANYNSKFFELTIDNHVVQLDLNSETPYTRSKTSYYNYKYTAVEIPVILKHSFFDRKISLEGGASINYLLSGTTETKHELENETLMENTVVQSKIFYSAIFGITYKYDFSDKLSLSVTPNLRLLSGAQALNWQDIKLNVIGLKVNLWYNAKKETKNLF